MITTHRCICGHIELDVPGRYMCQVHGEQLVGMPNAKPYTIRYIDKDES